MLMYVNCHNLLQGITPSVAAAFLLICSVAGTQHYVAELREVYLLGIYQHRQEVEAESNAELKPDR